MLSVPSSRAACTASKGYKTGGYYKTVPGKRGLAQLVWVAVWELRARSNLVTGCRFPLHLPFLPWWPLRTRWIDRGAFGGQ